MSAAQWRRAMNSGATASVPSLPRVAPRAGRSASTPSSAASAWGAAWRGAVRSFRPRHLVILFALLVYPFVASPFFTFQIGAQSFALGLIALSLTFLGGYGGMVSLAQMTVAGLAGYLIAIFGASSAQAISLGWPWWLGAVFALAIATAFATAIGWLSIRTEGIYTIMITLAIGVAFFYLAQQNYTLFNGFQGFNQVKAPTVGEVDFRQPVPFYFLALVLALAGYTFVCYLVRAPFGMALQGVRDNPRRMAALGYAVTAHRVAAYAVAGFIAAVGGVLMVWYNGRISPGTVNLAAMVNILVVAVLGGMKRPVGAFIGALVFVLLQNFAIDAIPGFRERFNLVIGAVFLAIVLFSPDGLLGLWTMLKHRLAPVRRLSSHPRRP